MLIPEINETHIIQNVDFYEKIGLLRTLKLLGFELIYGLNEFPVSYTNNSDFNITDMKDFEKLISTVTKKEWDEA